MTLRHEAPSLTLGVIGVEWKGEAWGPFLNPHNERIIMTSRFSYLTEDYADMSRVDAAWQIADREIQSEEAEYRNDNLLGTDRDAVCQKIADDIMEAKDSKVKRWQRVKTFFDKKVLDQVIN